ncbi:MAG: lipopolysaccharide heptosyltransferase II [Negativicutes bacterium]|nr:lipopolysaccharide heptosyltransferase II [Negativicutes bacterium]MDR3590936.1 lipopolysaccharide heptosyltransferase II [Negativicutes bacterium]
MPNFRKILLGCTLAIGDVVMATSAAALLKKIYPEARISIIVKKLAEEVVINNPVIDEVISANYQQKKASFDYMRNLVKHLKSQQYDLFVSLDGKFRPALLATLAGIPVRIGPSSMFGSDTRLPLLFTTIYPVGDFKTTHYTEVLQSMVRRLTNSQLAAQPVLPCISPDNHAKAASLLERLPASRHLIGFCAKTNPRKTWPAQRFADLMTILSEKYDAAIYTIGGPYDQEYIDNLISLTTAPVANFCGQTSLVDLMALLTKTDVFVSLDTAPMHIASAMDIPLVAVFGSTAPASVAPLSAKAAILAPELPCIPCIPLRVQVFPGISRWTGPKTCPEQRCMNQITVDQVLAAITHKLSN